MSFPRGFAFLIDTTNEKIIGTSAFYPKFGNDNLQDEFDKSNFATDSSLDLHIKYSGFLGKVVLFNHPEHGLSYGTFSKNSAHCASQITSDNQKSFCQKLHEAVAPSLPQERISSLWEQGIRGICCEVMSKDDEFHGYSYHHTGYVVTSMTKADDTFCTPDELYETCSRNDLPIHIEGADNVQAFISELIEVRDLLTYPQLQTLFIKHQLPTTNLHADIINSPSVEGFVLRRPDGTRVKFKCWPYLMVTMVLRQHMQGNKFSLDDKPNRRCLDNDGNIVPALQEAINSKLPHWVSSKKPEIQQLAQWLIEAAIYEEKKPSASGDGKARWLAYSEVALNRFDRLLKNHDYNLSAVYKELEGELPQVIETPSLENRSVILVLGPIGYGKSTFARQLAESNSNLEFIDGDHLGIGNEAVRNLKQVRNQVTCATVQSSIIRGRIPILATGGGAILHSHYREKQVDSQTPYLTRFLNMTGIQPCYSILVPGPSYSPGHHDSDKISDAYNDTSFLNKTLKQRKQAQVSGWQRETESHLTRHNQDNHGICTTLMSEATLVSTYPRCLDGQYTDIPFDQISNELSKGANHEPLASVTAKVFQQYYTSDNNDFHISHINKSQRHITLPKQRLWHRTLFFSELSLKQPMPKEEAPYGQETSASFTAVFNREDDKFLCSLIRLPKNATGAHLTINQGSFEAKDMKLFAQAISEQKNTVDIPANKKQACSSFVSSQKLLAAPHGR